MKKYKIVSRKKAFVIKAKAWEATPKAKRLRKIVKPTDAAWKNYAMLRTLQHGIVSDNETYAAAAAEAYDAFAKTFAFADALQTQREVRKEDYWEWD